MNPDFRTLGLVCCKLSVFPEFLRAMKNLDYLDLSDNELHGRIPDWAGEIGGNELLYLNLSYNSITGLPQFQWEGLEYLCLQNNMIEGPFPLSICSMSHLNSLRLSHNQFSGVLPSCFGNISSSLAIIDLGNNHFHGTIPDVYVNNGVLQALVLYDNQLEGVLPATLSKFRYLEILDLENNNFNSTFPGWLGDLPYLRVLILRSNKFHGPC